MPARLAAAGWRRDLPEFVSVTVEGTYGGVDPDITERTPGRIVITMPDFTADALAHALSCLSRVADAMNRHRVGVGERELAEALFEAAHAGGYRCPSGHVESETV
jgi:hypothetical protein